MVANAAITPTVQLGEEFKSVADLDGKTFAIVNKAEQKALFGSSAQNLGYDVYSNAFVTTNSGYLWKLVSLADNADESIRGYYMLRLITPTGGEYSVWGSPGFLNTQPADQAVSFILGITNKKNGQDIDNGAVYDVQYEEGKGFSLKNIGTGLYQGANTAPAKNEEPTYFTFATVTTTYVPALKALLAEGEAMKKRGASSAAYDAAIEGIDPDKSEDALADAQKVEAALPALAVTQLTAGSDFTRAIANFDCGAKDGWTFEKPLGGNGPDHGGDFEYWAGNASNRAEASFDYWQEITGLPNGTYTVSAEMYNSLNNEGGDYTEFKPTVGVYATVGEKTVSKLVDVNSETRVPYVTDVIEVTDGKIRIGAKSFEAPMAARWFTVDNFKLTLVKPAAAPPAPEKDAWFNEINFCFRDKASSVATSKERTFAVWGADPDDVSNGCIVATAGKNGSVTNAQFWIRGAEYVEPTYIGETKDQLTAVYDKGGFAAGTGFKVTMRVKADGEYSAGSQTHKAFQHKSNNGFGDLKVTTEWQTVTFVCVADDDKAGFTDLTFNLANADADRTFYFDDIQIVRGSEWYLNNEFRAKDYLDPAATYADGNDPYPMARYVADGDYVEVISNAGASQTYNSQIWIAIPQEFVGTMTKMTMEVQASKAMTTPESFQATATGNGWGCNPGPGKGVEFTVGEWTTIERVLNTKNVKSSGTWKDLQADQYCLDLSDVSDAKEAVTYKFKNVKFEAAQEDWYSANPVYAKDYTKGTETYTDGVVFPKAPYVYGSGDEGGYIEVVSNANAENDYASQIFFEIPEELRGKNVLVRMKVKASQEISVATALHGTADGNGWSPNPAGDAVAFTVDKWVDIERTFNTDCKDKNGDPVAYYVMNLSDNNGKAAIKYDFDEVSFKEFVDWGELVEVPVDGELIWSKDWTKETSYGYWSVDLPAGYTRSIDNGLVIENTSSDGNAWDSQFFVADGISGLKAGAKYLIRYTMKIKGEGSLQTNFGSWGTNTQTVLDLENGYRQVVFEFPDWSAAVESGAHIIFQSRKFVGDIIIENVEVFEDYLDPATLNWTDNLFTNGDVEGEDMSSFIAKVNDDEDALLLPAATKVFKESNQVMVKTAAREADPEKEGSYLGNDHDTQFFVRLPYALKKGNKYFFSVDYISNKVADVQSQTHAEPGEWKSNNGVGKITTGSAAQTLEGYFTADNDMRTIAFNLASATEGGTFYFDNFVFKVVVEEEADIKAFTQTWDETSKWNETLALNVAYDNGRNAETEGCTEESVKALDDAMAAGKAILQPAEGAEPATKEAIAAAAKAIEDAIAGLEKGKPELAYTDLTKEMFFHWNAADETAEALEASNCDYNIGTSTGQPYGLSTVNHDRFADLSAYNTIELTATEGEPRLLFNRIENEGTVFAEVPRDKDKYETVVDNGDGSKTYVIDIAAIVAEYGFAHLHAIKGANWANTTVTEIKLGYVGEKPELPIPTTIEGVETEGESIADGKYIENGQIVIVKGGKKYTVAGVEIK